MQLAEADEREENQRKLYDKMIAMMDFSNDCPAKEEQFNSSQMSLGGREVDLLHK
jgi:hypothetical protein